MSLASVAPSFKLFSSSAQRSAKRPDKSKKRASHDPYIVAQRNLKTAANRSRRAELEQGRQASLGDPVHGTSTLFIESFETGTPIKQEEAEPAPKDTLQLNYAFRPKVAARQIQRSKKLAVPLSEIEKPKPPTTGYAWTGSMHYNNPEEIAISSEEAAEKNKVDHSRATEAVTRIIALENGSSKDRMRANITRCVEMFGRHNTDRIFPPRAPTLKIIQGTETHPVRPKTNIAATRNRIGPDTGSSEVQIAILTAKIKTLADFLATRGKGDKHNKRNLRLLVHRRQKLLQYFRRKERGGPRWQHCIETLGLTEGTWRGEITL